MNTIKNSRAAKEAEEWVTDLKSNYMNGTNSTFK